MLSRLSLNNNIKNGDILKIYSDNKFIGLGKIDFENDILRYLKCEKQ